MHREVIVPFYLMFVPPGFSTRFQNRVKRRKLLELSEEMLFHTEKTVNLHEKPMSRPDPSTSVLLDLKRDLTA